MSNSTTDFPFRAAESVIGGAYIGVGAGVFMWAGGRVAGNSGVLKAALVGPREAPKIGFLVGLGVAGALMSHLLGRSAFEPPPEPSAALFFGGAAIGLGTSLGNGCTSGHGLCGISRLSKRSFVAVATFMSTAILTATAKSGFEIGSMVPVSSTPTSTLNLAGALALTLGAVLVPVVQFSDRQNKAREAFVGLWCGMCFGVGMATGGMVRPDTVVGALSLAQFNPTLWILFGTALGITAVLYRAAATISGVKEACPVDRSVVSGRLVAGAALFGIGWGYTGFCPGPLLVVIAAYPLHGAPIIVLGGVIAGQLAVWSYDAQMTLREFKNKAASSSLPGKEGDSEEVAGLLSNEAQQP